MEETNEKEKRKRRLFVVLLLTLAIAATGSLIGTIAKYVTTETVSDGADAARFGLNIPKSIDLFSESYTSNSQIHVQSDTDGRKIIAPGTSGYYTFLVSGTSEVAYVVNAVITLTYSEEWGTYAPLEFSLDGVIWTDFETFSINLSAALASNVMAPNTTYSNAQTIYWRWPFYVSAENDIKDTAIGVISAGTGSPSVTVTIVMAASQVE